MHEETESKKKAEGEGPEEDGVMGESTLRLLSDEHTNLLASLVSLRVTNRVLLFLFVLVDGIVSPRHNWGQVAALSAGILIISSWVLSEVSTFRRLRRIWEFLARATTDIRVRRTLILWRHEGWRDSQLEKIQRLEPFIWFVLICVVTLFLRVR
jgi:hypothetical protein